eukprot:TRINITY_DN17632_c0_g2_i1.p4 TRINITY_DN17632_c0_g2~~TRINITY_DN17632_c0_g2_i1.p4  ORF type:complete len:167 (-),score=34.10 TRINITY_DN17632_c0_g2_i1:136-636(-)
MNFSGQDWEPVVIRKKPQKASQQNSQQAVNAARRTGGQVETVKKYAAASNASHGSTGTGQSARKLEEETENFHHDRVSTDLKKAIQSARLAKKMSQADLAKAINEKPNVIQEYETGKAIPNPQVLAKLSRVLGVPLGKKGPAKSAAPAKSSAPAKPAKAGASSSRK